MTITLNGTTGITTPDVTTDDLTVDTNTLYVDSTNNRVGIGTSSPSQQLHVDAGSGNDAYAIVSGGTSATLVINGDTDNSGDSAESDAKLILTTDGSYDSSDNSGFGSYSWVIHQKNQAGASSLAFTETRGAGTTYERMIIDNDGYLGIGGDPDYKFDLFENRTTYSARIFNDGNTDTRRGLIIRCGSDTGAGTNTPILFQDGDETAVGSITFTGGTVSYGTFTAWHPCVLPEGVTEYPYGTLLEIVSTYNYEKEGADYKQAIRYNVQKTQAENSKSVIGVYAGSLKDIYEDEPNLHQTYVLGDGHILCNNSGGNIKIGDGICSSNVAGIGKKATINPSMIIGIAQENVTFENSEETKLVAVQYGLQQFTPWVD